MLVNRVLTAVALFLVATIQPVPLVSAQDALDVLAMARSNYRALEFDSARAILSKLIAEPAEVRPDDIAEAHMYLGLIEFNTAAPTAARDHFISALSLNTGLTLDPLDASPKVFEFFAQVRSEYESIQVAQDISSVRYVVVEDPRVYAALRSMVFPGWGQVYKGEKRKGYVLAGSWLIVTGVAASAQVVRADKRRSYINESDPTQVSERFDSYSRWHKVRNTMAAAAIGVWIASYVDAFISRSPIKSNKTVVILRPGLLPGEVSVAVSMGF